MLPLPINSVPLLPLHRVPRGSTSVLTRHRGVQAKEEFPALTGSRYVYTVGHRYLDKALARKAQLYPSKSHSRAGVPNLQPHCTPQGRARCSQGTRLQRTQG